MSAGGWPVPLAKTILGLPECGGGASGPSEAPAPKPSSPQPPCGFGDSRPHQALIQGQRKGLGKGQVLSQLQRKVLDGWEDRTPSALVSLSAPPPLPRVGVRELGPGSQVRVFPTLPPLQSKGGSSLLTQVETGPCWHLNSPTENFGELETPSSGKDKSGLSSPSPHFH